MVHMTILFIFMLLNSHQVALETVIERTYYNTELSWTDAKDFCFNQSSILEGNHTDTIIRSENETTQIWTGSYTTWSDWAVIWGCYASPRTVSATFEDTNDGRYDCQQYCKSSQYFAFEGGACYCLNETGSSVSYSFCKTPRQTTSYVIVYKQNITGVQRSLDDIHEDQLKCMSAQCQEGEIILRSETCNSYYEGICESGFNNGSNTTQQSAATLCDNADSFLQWYNNKSFCDTGKTNQLWTSATRVIHTYDLTTNDQASSINPMMCQYMDIRNSSTALGNCTDRRTFICRFEKIGLPSETVESNNIIGISMYGLMGLISLVIVVIIIIVGIKTSNHGSSNKRKKEDVKEHAAVVNKRSYSVQITELQSPLEDIIEDSETSNEQSSDGRNSGNGSVLEVQTSFKNDKLNKRLTTFKRGSHQSKPELGNITTGKADETSDYDDSINNICHTKTQTEQSVLNSNTKNIESHHIEHIPCINSRSEHEDNYHPTKDFKEQYQPNKPTITINQDSKTETENKICPELALQVDFDDIKDSEEFSNPASLITNKLSGDNNDIEDSQDVSNSSRRQIDYTDELTGDYDDIEDLEDESHATRRQNEFTYELTGDYDDIKDSKDVTDSSRGPLVFTNDFTGGDYDDIDTSEEMSAPFQCTHVFTSERIPDYDEIDERKDAITPNEEKHIFTKKLSLKGIYDGIDETTQEMIPANNVSKFTFTEENDSKSSISQFDDYDEIEDSSDTMYTTTDPYIGMSHGSSATKEQYMDMSQGIRATQLSNSDGSSTTNTNSNHPPLGKRTNEPIYAISSKKSMKIKSKDASLVPETLLKSENIATTNIYSNSSSPSITNEPIYAISTKKSMKLKSKEDNLVPETISNIENMTTTNSESHNSSSSISNEPIYAISTKSSMKIKSKEPDLVTEPVYAISSKKSSEM